MKTLLLSSDDIQNFSKLVCDPKSATQLTASSTVGGVSNGQASNYNLMALQYYIKHSNNTPATTAVELKRSGHAPQTVIVTQGQAQQQLLTQSQMQLKQFQLKQPTIYHQQHSSFHHHPYYQHTTTTLATAVPVHSQSHTYTYTHAHSNSGHSLPVYALNQNSNFSAASSSTGGGTASSHAPTQQSNTTGSSLSPPSTSASARTVPAAAHLTGHNSCATKSQALLRANTVNGGTKKLKVEPVLSQFHQTERLSFANTHIVWGEEHWKRVVFQDERKFNLDGPDGFSYYFHDLRNYERTLSQRPRGNSVYIYVLITAGGPIHLEVATAKQKPETCIETILRERVNIVTKLGGNADFILQDHNWTANAMPSTQEWLSAEGIKTQKWPTVAHDLDIMENVWGWLIREVYDGGRKFSRKDDLIFRIREAWARLPVDLLSNLYSTLPERITELYYTRGVYTNC